MPLGTCPLMADRFNFATFLARKFTIIIKKLEKKLRARFFRFKNAWMPTSLQFTQWGQLL